MKELRDLSLKELDDYMKHAVRVLQMLKFGFDVACLSFMVAGATFILLFGLEMPYKVAIVIPIVFSLFSYQLILPRLKNNLMEISWILMLISKEMDNRESGADKK